MLVSSSCERVYVLSTKRSIALTLIGASLALIALFAIGCGDDSPVEPAGPGNPGQTFSNMAFDRFGVAVVPGASSVINVTPLAGSLEPFTVVSSDEGVASASGSVTAAAGAGGAAAGMITVTGVGHGSATISVTTPSGDKRDFPVTVYDPTVLDTGELLVKFTDQFGGRFHDSGSGADNDGDFYHPIAPAGYYPLGSIGYRGYQNPNNLKTAVIVVKDKGTNTANPPLKAPVGYEHIWNNGIWFLGFVWSPDGSDTGSFWRPIPPDGYVALGVVVHNWVGGTDAVANDPRNQPPPLDAVMCVREDLTQTAKIGGFVWHDGGNGLPDRFFRADQLLVPDNNADYESMHLAPGTFIGNPTHNVNDISNPVANVLKIDPQVLVDADYHSNLLRPKLSSLAEPGNLTQPLKTRAILVPFTAFFDAGKDINWKVANSPFYLLERTYSWHKECFASGLNDCLVDYDSGSSTSTEKTQWESESVEASVQAGFALKGVGGKVTSTVTKTMGFAESRGVSEFFARRVVSTVPRPGEGAIIVTWKAANRFTLSRHNGLVVEEVVLPWTMYEDAFHSDKFP